MNSTYEDSIYNRLFTDAFKMWLNNRCPDVINKYPLTQIKVDDKLYVWMNPTIQDL